MTMPCVTMKVGIVVIAINQIKVMGTKLIEVTTQGNEAGQEEDREGDPEAGFFRVRTTFRGIERISLISLRDSGSVTQTPFRRREDMETKEDKERVPGVALVRARLQDIEIIRIMDLRNGVLGMEAVFSLIWAVQAKAVEGVNRNQNRSQRAGDEEGEEEVISRNNIKFQEIFRRAPII